jgi:hypothetical protein
VLDKIQIPEVNPDENLVVLEESSVIEEALAEVL